MDRPNAKPSRPSLLASGDMRAEDRAPGAGRILTDVEQGTAPRVAVRGVRRWSVPVMSAAVVALGIFAWSTFDDLSRSSAVAETPSLSVASSSTTPHNATEPRTAELAPASPVATDTATIVDADNPFGSNSSMPKATARNPFGETAGSRQPVKRANPFATTPAGRLPAIGDRTSPKLVTTDTKAAASNYASVKAVPSAPVKPQTEARETALGNSLLGNIDSNRLIANAAPSSAVQSDHFAVAPSAVGADREALDALVLQIDALQIEASMAAGANAVADTAAASGRPSGPAGKIAAGKADEIDTNKPLTRAEKLQRDLRRCPKANTTSGVNCRIKVCRDYGGKDPVCAVKH